MRITNENFKNTTMEEEIIAIVSDMIFLRLKIINFYSFFLC